jgi:hypothetical protein
MPAAITHFLQAEKVMDGLEKLDTRYPVDRDAFLWGAQGPDFLYCHRCLPWQRGNSLKQYAEKLHREKPLELFKVMREYVTEKNPNQVVESYLYGFLCHYSLDRISHPYIQYHTKVLLEKNAGQNEAFLHNQIESVLDTIMLRYEKGRLPVEFNLKWTVPKNRGIQSQIADLYAFVFYQLYGLNDSRTELFQATEDCRRVFGLLNDRTTMKKALAERLEKRKKLCGLSCRFRPVSEGDEYDYANVLLSDWYWPLDNRVVRNENFFTLYDQSIQESLDLIQCFSDADRFEKETGNQSFI